MLPVKRLQQKIFLQNIDINHLLRRETILHKTALLTLNGDKFIREGSGEEGIAKKTFLFVLYLKCFLLLFASLKDFVLCEIPTYREAMTILSPLNFTFFNSTLGEPSNQTNTNVETANGKNSTS